MSDCWEVNFGDLKGTLQRNNSSPDDRNTTKRVFREHLTASLPNKIGVRVVPIEAADQRVATYQDVFLIILEPGLQSKRTFEKAAIVFRD